MTVLSIQAMYSNDPEVIRILLEAGANPLTQVGGRAAMGYIVNNKKMSQSLKKLSDFSKTKRLIIQTVDSVVGK